MNLIPLFDLQLQHAPIKTELLMALDRVLSHSGFILGEEVEAFENEFAAYCGSRYAVGVANGTDAITMTLQALGIGRGDEVITAPNSYLASASAIALAGATPVFVDVRDDYNINPASITAAITNKTKAILPVHLTGRPADLNQILSIAKKYQLAVIEDAAQAVGAKYNQQRVGTFGQAGCFSFHPLKNLGACGDAGAIITNDESTYRYLIKARNHGLRNRDECQFWSYNSRLDALQAAMLRVKLKYLDDWTEARRDRASFYKKGLTNWVKLPFEESANEYAVYSFFVIEIDRRNQLKDYLLNNHGIDTKIHYPLPIHLQEASQYLGYKLGDFPVTEKQSQQILSLPVYPELTRDRQEYIINAIRNFLS